MVPVLPEKYPLPGAELQVAFADRHRPAVDQAGRPHAGHQAATEDFQALVAYLEGLE